VRLAILLSAILSLSAAHLDFQVSTNAMVDLSPLLGSHLERTKFPALAAAVVHGTNVLAAAAVGLRKAGEAIPVTLHDRFHIGSCTKSMTALLAVLLEKDGKIQLTNTIGEVLKDWKIPKETAALTLVDLLQNRSGIGNEPDDKLWRRAFFNPSGSPREQRRRFLVEILQAPLSAAPGSKFIYSNLGYAVAGAMLETAVDGTWEELMQKKIFDSLKLLSAGFGPPGLNGGLDQPWGHNWKDGVVEPAIPSDNPAAIAPAGAVHLGILDCARYAAFHLAVAQGKVGSLKAYRHTLYSAPKDSTYAFGWNTVAREWAGGKALTHAGSNTMFYTVIWIAPEKDFACVVATNIGDREDHVAAQCDILVAELIEKFLR
jgi:CubicO group peptidase (beta-lactamase class C family)